MMLILLIHKKLQNINNLKHCSLKSMKKEETIDRLIEYVSEVPKDDDSENRKYL